MLLSSASYMFFTMLSRISGFIREVLLARYLGVGMESDAFFAAWRIPNSFRKLLADGGVSAAFVPLFVKVRTQSVEKSDIFSANIAVILFAITCFITLLVEIFTPSIIAAVAPGFVKDQAKMDLTILLSRIMMPYLPLISMVALLGGILNGVRVFSYFAAIQVIQNLSMIISVFIFGDLPNFVNYLSFSAVVGGVIQIAIMLYACKRNSVLPKFRFAVIHEIWHFFKSLFPVLISQGAMQINIFVGTIFATMTVGATSYLAYTDRIGLFATTMIGYTLGTISLPLISKKISIGDKIGAIEIQKQCIEWAILLAVPAAIAMIILSQQIVTALYASPKFGIEHIIVVSKMLQFYAIAVPFIAINRIFNSSFFANSDTKIPMYIGITSALTNVVLNIILIKHIGFYAMIISTTICSMIEFLLLCIFLKTKYNFLGLSTKNIKYLIISIICSLIISVEAKYISSSLSFSPLLSLLFAIFIAIISYILLLVLTQIISIKDIWKMRNT